MILIILNNNEKCSEVHYALKKHVYMVYMVNTSSKVNNKMTLYFSFLF